MRIKNLLLTFIASFISLGISAQLENGKVYRFINKADTNIALTATSLTDIYGSQKTDNSYSQLWLAETYPNISSAWRLRSLGNGLYVVPNGTSQGWTFTSSTTPRYMFCVKVSDNYYTFNTSDNTSGSSCMHYATSQGGRVVGWNTDASATSWTIEEVTISPEELEANWQELDKFNSKNTPEYLNTCQTALNNLFEDGACTKLKSNFTSVATLENDANYKALPEELQNMAKKILNGDWSEDNYDSNKEGWNSEQAKKFRIQSYEPYSTAGDITAWLGINAHINMDNPTGLFGNSREHIYVMVEGEIKTGAKLLLQTTIGHSPLWNGTAGTTLHEGLNIIPFSGDKNAIFINYLVDTYNENSKTFPHKLSDFPNLKIHIEGGNINGYYNAVGDHLWGAPDDDNDWLYYEARANLDNILLLGKRQILQFHLNRVQYEVDGVQNMLAEDQCLSYYFPDKIQVPAGTPENQKVNTLIEAWDRIHLSELATMGLLSKAEIDSMNNIFPRYNEKWEKAGVIYGYSKNMYDLQDGRDYSEYFNHHGLAYGNFSGYMSGGWQNCNYHHNTMSEIIGKIAKEAGATWGPAHEIGHQHQSAMTVNGLTEVTNNLFSNVAVWYMGIGTSRVNGAEGNLERANQSYQNGDHFLFHHLDNGSQNLWTQTQMYYKLWLYYHRCGNNTDFFPRLYELLRQQPMNSAINGYESEIGDDGKSYPVYKTTGKASTLLFYKHACVAAGEDLTEFFRAHGFFVPLDNALRGDYSSSRYTQTQEDIDEAIAWVKNLGLKENILPLFINDCVATPSYSHDGKTQRNYWDNETRQNKNALLGMYTDFMNTSAKVEGYYYTRKSYTNITISRKENASGALGFAVYHNDELLAFTSNYSVNIPSKYNEKQVTVYAIQADGSKVPLPDSAEAGNENEQLQALNTVLTIAKDSYEAIATSTSQTGYYYPQYTDEFASIYEQALEAKNTNNQEKHTYGEWAKLLNDAMYSLAEKENSWIPVKEKNRYRIQNFRDPYYSISVNNNGNIEAVNKNYELWSIIPTEDGKYNIQSSNGLYIINTSNGTQITTSSGKELAAKYTLNRTMRGTFEIVQEDGTAISLIGKTIKGGATNDAQSRWILTVEEDHATAAESVEIEKLIKEAEKVVSNICKEYTETSIEVKDNVVSLIEEATFTQNVLNLIDAKQQAENNKEDAFDLYVYISPLKNALEALEGAYIIVPDMPKASTATQPVWYYIKSIENGTYCTIDLNSTGTKKDAIILEDMTDKETATTFWWSFYPTDNEGEYTIVNGYHNAAMYKSATSIKATEGEEATPFTLTLVPEEYGFSIKNGNNYWYYSNGAIKTTTTISRLNTYWTIEEVPSDMATGIETVETDKNTVEGIYDLSGRRLNSIEEPGIYIVNGKKILVK